MLRFSLNFHNGRILLHNKMKENLPTIYVYVIYIFVYIFVYLAIQKTGKALCASAKKKEEKKNTYCFSWHANKK